MDLKLVMFKADGERREFPITHPVTIIGRKHTCDLRVPISSVSREHCQVELRDDGAYIRDLGSSNGTYHQDGRVTEAPLSAGDTIVVGPCHFFVVIDGEPGDIDPVRTVLPGGGEVQDLSEVADEPPSVTAEAEPDDAMAALASAAADEAGSAGEADDDAFALEIEPGESFDEDEDDEPEAAAPPPPPKPAPKPAPEPEKKPEPKPEPPKPAAQRPDSPTKKSADDEGESESESEEVNIGLAAAGQDEPDEETVKGNTDDALAAMLGGDDEDEADNDPFSALDALANAGGEASEDDALAWLEEDDDEDDK